MSFWTSRTPDVLNGGWIRRSVSSLSGMLSTGFSWLKVRHE
jgi:hypothetical protein